MHPAQKTLNQEKVLKKFSDFHQEQIQVNHNILDKELNAKLLQQKKFRDK